MGWTLDKYYKTVPFLELGDLCFPSCLWNHNRLWQVCPDSHPRQQAQVRIILFFIFVTDQLIMEGFGVDRLCVWPVRTWLLLSIRAELIMFLLDRELQENLVRSHSAGDTSYFFPDILKSPGASRSLGSCVVVCRCGKPAEPRKDPHVARSEDQCSGQRAQWNFSGNPASHDPSLQR